MPILVLSTGMFEIGVVSDHSPPFPVHLSRLFFILIAAPLSSQEKTSKLRSLSSKKDTQRSSKHIFEKENAAAAGANCDNAEAKTEEVERMNTRSMMNDSVVTANEAGGRHRGRPVLRTVSEDEDHIAFHNDHVEHDMDGLDENEKMKRNQRESKTHPQKPRRMSPWRLQERQVKNILIEAQRMKKQIAP